MAKKRKGRRRPRASGPSSSPTATATRTPSATPAARQQKKEAKRLERERAAKAHARRAATRRALIGGLVGLVVFLAISWFQRPSAPTPLSAAALAAAQAAKCGDLQTPYTDPARNHIPSGSSYTYDMHPAVAGPHDPTPLPDQPRVYTADTLAGYHETQAVHSLEHGSVIMYYRPAGDDGLPVKTVAALAPIAQNNPATYLIPYPDLPSGTSLAFTAWNKLLTCPGSITTAQATTLAQGFVESFACTSNAPEARNGPGC